MRLYRGLNRSYCPEEVRSRLKDTGNGTDFSDCPFTALSYAVGRNGVVLVLDVPDEAGLSVTEETWFVDSAKRLMVWGAFDRGWSRSSRRRSCVPRCAGRASPACHLRTRARS